MGVTSCAFALLEVLTKEKKTDGASFFKMK